MVGGALALEWIEADGESNVTQSSGIEYVLTRQLPRLKVCLQHVSGDGYGPEEGSDAWLLLNLLVSNSDKQRQALLARFEQSGRGLAEQGGKLDVRLQGLQRYIGALAAECKSIFRSQPLVLSDVLEHLHKLHSECLLTLTRGYQNFADQVMAERTRVSQQLERRLLALQHVNGVSNSNTDLDQTLEVTAQIVAEELDVELCSIFFYDELQRMLTLRATNGPRPLGGMHFTLRLGEGYSGWVADKGRPLLVHDALADPNFATEVHGYMTDYHGLMALPMIFFGSTERLIGVISVQSAEPRDFTREEISFVEVVAGIIAINMENGRLYEQTDEQLRRKVYELATIHRVSSIIASTLNLDEVLQIITTQAVHLSGAERSCIFELDPDTQRLHVLAHYGLDSAAAARMQLSLGHCCAGRTVQTGRPNVAIDCFHADKNCVIHCDPFISSEVHSVFCVPLQVKKKILGCICIYSSQRHPISQEQMQLVITFANEAAIAIENARLYEETRRGLELKSVLLRELHHRVKNNLATVAGILSLQMRRTRSPEIKRTLAESVNRVQGLAATHDLLAHEDVSEARVDDIARKIVGVANANLKPPDKHIIFDVKPCPIVIPSRAVSILALVLNEMVSNAIKHGMAHQAQGEITIRGWEEEGMVYVQVIDNGNGPPFEFPPDGVSESGEGLGLSLIKNLAGDLGGTFSLQREALAPTENPTGEQDACTVPPLQQTVAQVRFPLVRSRRS
jgi:two-component sensor histidine kinase/putative methionine-R-sulfoxide reductase with GAF domain